MKIESEAEYDAALLEADALMHAAPSTAEGNRLEALVRAIEDYEAEHWSLSEN